METNQKHAQEQPTQNILATTAIEKLEQSYDPLKAARIAETLTELLDPEYILLFGKLANRTPHSDILAYDLLAVTDGPAHYSWYDAKRYLKMKLPYIGHGAPYINLYIHTRHDIETRNVPFLYFARKEGIVLHSRSRKVARPRDKFDFGYAVSLAMKYSGIFMPLADKLAGYAECNLDKNAVLCLPRIRSRQLRCTVFAPPFAHPIRRVAFAVRVGRILSETNATLPKQFCDICTARSRFLRRDRRIGAALRPREAVRRDS